MKQTLKYLLFFCTVLSFHVLGANPELDWKVHESKHFKIHYPSGLRQFVPKVERLAETSHGQLSPFFNWEPKNKTNVVLIDEFDQANGFASPLPRNTITLFMQPPSGGELLAFDDWLQLLIHHEYTHTLHIDKVLDLPSFLRSIFGRFILLFPNALHPNWFQEGLATYLETDSVKGIGRGQSDMFQMMMRTEVESRFKPISRINVVNSHDWPLNTAYLYGVYFFKFIHDVYGEKAIKDLVDNYSENIVPYRVSSNPELVTGKSLESLWVDFEQYVKGYFQPQIDRIANQEITKSELINSQFFSYGEFAYDGDGIWFSAIDEYQGANLYWQSSETSEHAITKAQLNSIGSLDVHLNGEVVISQIDICDNYNAYYDLYLYDKHELIRLTECKRYRQARWFGEKNILALRYDKAIPYLDELSRSGAFVKNHWQGKEGDIISSFDVEGENIVAAYKRGQQYWQIVKLVEGSWKPITDSPSVKIHPNVNDGKVLFVQGQLGQMEVHQVSLKGGDVTRLTQTQTGWGQVQILDQSLGLGLKYTGEGYKLASLDLKPRDSLYFNNELYQKEKNRRQEIQDVREAAIDDDVYYPFSSLLPTYWMPVLVGDGELSEVGVFTSGNDVLGNHLYTAQLTYESTTSKPLVNGTYIYANKWVAAVGQSLGETGAIETATGDDVFKYNQQWLLGRMFPNISISHSFFPFLAVAKENVSYITAEKNQIGVADLNNNWIGLGVTYDGLRSSRWASDHTSGWQGTVSIESANLADSNVTEGDVLNLGVRHYQVFDNDHIVAQRFFTGIGFDSTSNFVLGGSSSDAYIGPGVTLNERSYPLRGYEELDGLSGENVVLYSLEYRLPFKWRDHTIMAPPIGVSGWSIRSFVDNGIAWQDGESISDAEYKAGLGAELVFDSNLFYYLNLKFRLGFASGVSEGGDNIIYSELGGSF